MLACTMNLVLMIRRRRLRYFGHILRMDEDRFSETIFSCLHSGGDIRPAGSLIEDCSEASFEKLTSLAMDRTKWKRL